MAVSQALGADAPDQLNVNFISLRIIMKNALDNQVAYWNGVSSEKNFTHPLNTEKIKQYIAQDSAILDFGCGYGRIGNELHNLGFTNIVGIDSSEGMIARGRRAFPYLHLKVFQGNKVPFDANEFDAVVLFAVLTCIPTNAGQKGLVSELFRVLRPGGIIYVSDYWLQQNERNRKRYNEFQTKFDQYGVFELPEGAVVRHHTRDWIKELFADFHTVEMLDCEVESMNGNKSSCFQLIGRKPENF